METAHLKQVQVATMHVAAAKQTLSSRASTYRGGRSVDANKDAHIEIDGQGHNGDEVALVARRVSLHACQQDAQRLLVVVLAVQRVASVLCVACFCVVATEDGNVGGGYHEQAALGDRLDGGIEELDRSAVGVQVHDVKVLQRRAPLSASRCR